MKYLTALIVAVCFVAVLAGCADKPPSVRAQNLRANKANVQFKQSDGNTINHNDVQPGTSSNYQDVAPGIIEVKAEMQNESNLAEKSFVATDNKNYTLVILAGDPPTIRVDEQSK